MEKSRRQLADDSLVYIMAFLKEAGWTIDESLTFFHVDPITNAKYPTDTAYSIQLGRDLNVK